ncbi:uncharacterized protein LTR77_008084 [Saxophila tyrrhenica]|uniref:Uncharacterized protein n=1 Tax=Saxophila tyrrhenica TaxID=1690608 RepID=A0AAV9P4K6_9PEZI|nr:hypothetical protein LTR77_008084 [Saxophila tyrrhenica]
MKLILLLALALKDLASLVDATSTAPIPSPNVPIASTVPSKKTTRTTGSGIIVTTGSSIRPSGVFTNSTTDASRTTLGSANVDVLPRSSPYIITIGPSITASRGQSGIVIASETIKPGGSAYTAGIVTISLGSSNILKIGGSTTSLPIVIINTPTSTSTATTGRVTSTMTTLPPDVSTKLIHPPSITTNTWITTNEGGHHTIVPALWCQHCAPGGRSGLVVVWNFPKLQWVEFDWPDFPNLPHFHLPCIKIFGVRISGDCPSPQSDEHGGDDDDGDNDNENDKSSTETCSTSTTVRDCKVGCSLSFRTTDSIRSTSTVCFTTMCEQTVGCSLEATTTSTVSTPSSGPVCGLAAATPYNPMKSFSELGASSPLWMQGGTPPPVTKVRSASSASTSASYISCSTQQPDPDQGINSGYCVCAGSTLAFSTTASPPNSCAYTTIPESTIAVSVTKNTITRTALCEVCTYVGAGGQCSSLSNCTPSPTATPSSVAASSTTLVYPTATNLAGGVRIRDTLCYQETGPGYEKFSNEDAKDAADAMRNRGHELSPRQTFAYAESFKNGAGVDVTVAVEWADDQSGCKKQAGYAISGDSCQDAYTNIVNSCVGNAGKGGGWVYDGPSGCILWTMGAPKDG